MRIILLAVFAVLSCCVNVSAQSRLSYQGNSRGQQYMIDGEDVPFEVFRSTLYQNPVAAKQFLSARTVKTVGGVLSCVGGFAFGWGLGAKLFAGTDHNRTPQNPERKNLLESHDALLVYGGAVMAAGIVMSVVGNGKMNKALDIYNNPSADTSLKFGFTTSGVGFSMRF